MGYRIVYGEQAGKKLPVKKITLILSTAVVAAALLWPTGRSVVRDLLLPGDADVTTFALQGLVDDMAEGESVRDAVTTFCREIIAGGQ